MLNPESGTLNLKREGETPDVGRDGMYRHKKTPLGEERGVVCFESTITSIRPKMDFSK